VKIGIGTILIGLALVALGLRDIDYGESRAIVLTWICPPWDRGEHPLMFWISVLSWILPGLGLVVLGIVRCFSN